MVDIGRRAHGLVLGFVCLCLLGAACGQRPGVHEGDVSLRLTAEQYWGTADSGAPVGSGSGRPANLPPPKSGDSTVTGPAPVNTATPNTTGGKGDADGKDDGATGAPTEGPSSTTPTGTAPANGANPLKVCPVYGPFRFSDDFGAPRYAGGFHLHQGNDIFSPLGTPVVAPFDGEAVDARNKLGGYAVKVFGAQGYVYNAHLVGYGLLGPVRTGTVIGFVGNTGDADGSPPHDHFEWHPRNGPAVDPFRLLAAVC